MNALCKTLSALAWACVTGAVFALDVDLREAVLGVEVAAKDAFGKEVRATIEVTTYRPPGAGPFPLVVISHGRNSETRAQYQRQRYETAARYFVRKGFAVAVPLRLGYGETASLGDPESSVSCAQSLFAPALDAAARQVAQVVLAVQAAPDIDRTRLVLVGQSLGGATSVAANALQPPLPGLLAAVNFAGGHGGDPKLRPGEPCGSLHMERLMARYGATAAVPMLWLYSENDAYFNPQHSRRWAQAYAKAGATVDYQLQAPFGSDGHELFVKGADLWQPLLDQFLLQYGFTQPGQLQRPPAFGPAASVTPPGLGAKGQEGYAKFLEQTPPRAFAMGPDGYWGWATGDDALSKALANCQRKRSLACTLFAVDDQQVGPLAQKP